MLAGKRALITGGSGTIGKAIAKALLSENASVILTGRRLAKLEEAKRSLLLEATRSSPTDDDAGASVVHVIPSDVSEEESVSRLFREIGELDGGGGGGGDPRAATGGVDILVNNAGISADAPWDELTGDDLGKVLGVNVVGPFLCAREAMKRMKRNGGGGRIVNVGSISAFSPRPNGTAYATSKFAINGLSRSLALDGREHGIAVGAIHPGNVVSDLLTPEEVERRSAAEGFLQPDDVAQCVLAMLKLPYSANVLDLTVIPTKQPFVGRG